METYLVCAAAIVLIAYVLTRRWKGKVETINIVLHINARTKGVEGLFRILLYRLHSCVNFNLENIIVVYHGQEADENRSIITHLAQRFPVIKVVGDASFAHLHTTADSTVWSFDCITELTAYELLWKVDGLLHQHHRHNSRAE